MKKAAIFTENNGVITKEFEYVQHNDISHCYELCLGTPNITYSLVAAIPDSYLFIVKEIE